MKATKITYKRNFVIAQYVTESAELEIQLDKGDTEAKAIDYAKATIEDWHKKNNPNLQTDYFKGPEDIQQDKPTSEKVILDEIRQNMGAFHSKIACMNYVEQAFPEYTNHIVVKTIIKSKLLP